MKRKTLTITILAMISVSIFIFINAILPAKTDTLPKVLATVGSFTITSADLENYKSMKAFEKMYAETYGPDQKVETMTDEATVTVRYKYGTVIKMTHYENF